MLNNASNSIRASLEKRSNELLGIATQVAESETLQKFTQERNILGVLDTVTAIQRSSPVSNIAVLDNDGTVLARTHSIARIGDRRFDATASGRLLSRGIAIKGFDAGIVSPLIVTAGKTFPGGAVITGEPLDSIYADKLQLDVLPKGSHIAFYTLASGIVGDSFPDKETSRLVTTYFNPGSGLLAATSSAFFDRPLQIQGQNYQVLRTPLLGIGGPLGGFILFVPDNGDQWIILFAGFFSFIFLLISLLGLSAFERGIRPLEHIHIIVIFGTITLLLFSILVLVLDTTRAKSILPIQKPAYAIYNSILRFNPDNGIMDGTLPQRIALELLPGGEAINAVEATLTYNPKQIKIKDIITTTSLCDENLFLEKEIDNQKGEVRISCVIPHPGFQDRKGTVAEFTVEPIRPGATSIHIESARVLADDGLGTNVLRAAWSGSYIVASESPLEDLLVYSPTHPNQERWYPGRTVHLFWRSDTSSTFLVSLTPSESDPPNQEIASEEFTSTLPSDGTWYFHIKDTADTTHSVTLYKINVDTTPPEITLGVSDQIVSPGAVVRINIVGHDVLSGLQSSYYIALDDGIFFPSGPNLYLSFWEKGIHKITARVFDQAENYSESSATIEVR